MKEIGSQKKRKKKFSAAVQFDKSFFYVFEQRFDELLRCVPEQFQNKKGSHRALYTGIYTLIHICVQYSTKLQNYFKREEGSVDFFLTLWLVNSKSPEKTIKVSLP